MEMRTNPTGLFRGRTLGQRLGYVQIRTDTGLAAQRILKLVGRIADEADIIIRFQTMFQCMYGRIGLPRK